MATAILPAAPFYRAGEYHQDYAEKQPRQYGLYKKYSGREAFIEKAWNSGRKVTVYSTPRCHNCHEIKEYLKTRDITFDKIYIATNAQARNEIIDRTVHIGAPIVRIGEEFIFGYDPKKMDSLLI